jgi:alanyl-tRNA synthetase
LHKLVAKVAELMRAPYPELSETVSSVATVIKNEESNFLGTIDAGLERIERIFKQMKQERRSIVAGAEAADMFQTHGFPPELFETLAAERNLAFDWKAFRKEMEQHGIESGGGQKVELFRHDPLEALKKAMHGSTFVGYESSEVTDAKVIGIIASDQLCEELDELDHEQPIVVVLDKTPFYGEMGGQVGDAGEIANGQFHLDVIDAQIDGAFTLHRGHLREGKISLGATVTARVDDARRQAIRRAHSATHLLHHALQKHLGKHALQQGSKVDNDWLRFDFPNPSAVTPEEQIRIENEVNAGILAGEPIRSTNMPLAEARKVGAMMLFGEKYPDVVRMVAIGQFSKELCGGTHLSNTGQIGLFKLIGEESVAAGTRRITALTGRAALDHVRHMQASLSRAAAVLRTSPEEVAERVEALLKEVRQLKKQLVSAPKGGAMSVDYLVEHAAEVGGVKLVIAEVPGGPNDLRQLIDQLRRKAAPIAVLLGNRQDEEKKVMLIAGLSRDLVERGLSAVEWVRGAAAIVGGSGGGRPDMAQAGGKIPEKLLDAFAAARSEIEERLATN